MNKIEIDNLSWHLASSAVKYPIGTMYKSPDGGYWVRTHNGFRSSDGSRLVKSIGDDWTLEVCIPPMLRMPLTGYWFGLTKSSEKKEDYRDITHYWCKRLLKKQDADRLIEHFVSGGSIYDFDISSLNFRDFKYNVMTLGYPGDGDRERVLLLEHAGIEIRGGVKEWGATPGDTYFVIKHGNIIR